MAVSTVRGCVTSLIGCGFNGFGQLQLIPLRTSDGHTYQGNTIGSCRSTVMYSDTEMIVSCLTPLITFDTFECPREVCFSTAWDATFLFVEFSQFWATYSSSKWHQTLSLVEEHHLAPDEGIKKVFQQVENSLLLLTTKKRCLLVNSSNPNRLTCTEQPLTDLQTLIAISDSLQVYCISEGGKLHKYLTTDEPRLTPPGPLIAPSLTFAKAACGADHVILLTDTGCVYTFGLGSRGQLGLGHIQPAEEPVLVEALAGVPVKDIACGSWHSLALSVYGDVYSWGWNEAGQLGHSLDSRQPVVSLPTLIEGENGKEGEECYTSVGAGSRHSAALSDKMRLHVWGWNGYGQLGHVPGESATSGVSCELTQGKDTHLHLSCWNTFVVRSQQACIT